MRSAAHSRCSSRITSRLALHQAQITNLSHTSTTENSHDGISRGIKRLDELLVLWAATTASNLFISAPNHRMKPPKTSLHDDYLKHVPMKIYPDLLALAFLAAICASFHRVSIFSLHSRQKRSERTSVVCFTLFNTSPTLCSVGFLRSLYTLDFFPQRSNVEQGKHTIWASV